MPKRLTLALTVATGALAASPAGAATLDATVAVTPSKAGTVRQPAGVKLAVKLRLSEPSVITGFEVWNGRGLAFDRGDAPTCDLAALAQGPAGCPAPSIVGRGAMYGPGSDFDRPSGGGGQLTFVNGRGGKLLAYATISYPARVRAVLGHVAVDGARGPWPHRDAWTIPAVLQDVARMPVKLDEVSFSIGFTKAAERYISSTSCPTGGWAWRVRVHARAATGAAAVLGASGRAPCHR